MTFREQLKKLNACDEALEWVGNKSLEKAWKTCSSSEWMLWVLTKTDIDLTDPICDIAERVLHLVPKDGQAVCRRAIGAARRRASKDELNAARIAARSIATNATTIAGADSAHATDSIAYYAYCAATPSTFGCAAEAARSAAHYAAYALTDSAYNVSDSAYHAAYQKEQKKQCDILRKYFTITQVRKALKKSSLISLLVRALH